MVPMVGRGGGSEIYVDMYRQTVLYVHYCRCSGKKRGQDRLGGHSVPISIVNDTGLSLILEHPL